MRVLVYGLQSSGASLFTFFLGQMPSSLVVVDTWIHALTPPLNDVHGETDHIIAKAVVTTKFSVEDHIQSFRPDVTILVVRHPAHNYVSLTRKSYGPLLGTVDEKLRILEHVYQNRSLFDCVVSYESFVSAPEPTFSQLQAVGVPIQSEFYTLPRSHQSIVDFNRKVSPWCNANLGRKWGLGNIRNDRISAAHAFKRVPDAVRDHTTQLCPKTTDFAEKNVASNFSPGYIFLSSILNDVVKRKAVAGLKAVKQTVLPAH